MTETTEEAAALAAIKDALKSKDGSIRFVQTMSHGRGVQVHLKTRKIGPVLFPGQGQDLSDVLGMLGRLMEE